MTTTASCLPPLLEKAFATDRTQDATGAEIPIRGNISRDEAERLYRMVRGISPKASAEVGFAMGFSTLAIVQALEDSGLGEHFVADPYQSSSFQNQGLLHLEKAGLNHRLRFREEFVEDLYARLPPIQFAFVNASHLFDMTLVEFVLLDKRLEVGGVIGFHDLWMPSLRKLVRFVVANRSYELVRDFRTQPLPARLRLTRFLTRFLTRLVPGGERLLHPRLVADNDENYANMVFLRKTAEDKRPWQHFADF